MMHVITLIVTTAFLVNVDSFAAGAALDLKRIPAAGQDLSTWERRTLFSDVDIAIARRTGCICGPYPSTADPTIPPPTSTPVPGGGGGGGCKRGMVDHARRGSVCVCPPPPPPGGGGGCKKKRAVDIPGA
ncbi:hypothetical protein BKA62DRAFT_715638 [Auriculariales sp. MPI-PUGE-AT-0066]|nr:hypothetical protein BKA62DRAFT_715638 [Auriculariales sp. MPI-PUGE-AT-0066]